MYNRISHLLSQCHTQDNKFPPTMLYNEGWMLRLILDWFHTHKVKNHKLAFYENSEWYSEALLPSQFKPRKRGDSLGESYTHADGALGHFVIGDSGEGDLKLNNNAEQFIIAEAKMFSKLSAGVSHAKYFDQAARNVACVAEVMRKANLHPSEMDFLGFYVLAPEPQFEKEKTFKKYMTKESITEKVMRRVSEYKGRDEFDEVNGWFKDFFLPLIKAIDIECVSWEEVLEFIQGEDEEDDRGLAEFYEMCLKYNCRE